MPGDTVSGPRLRFPVATVLAAILGAALIGAGLIGILVALAPSAEPVLTDMRGNAVRYDPGEGGLPVVPASIAPSTPERLVVESVGLDVPLGAVDAVDGRILPPDFTSAFWVRNLGVSLADGDGGTVFVVMHSLRGGAVGPGNYLIDVEQQTSRVEPGARVLVGDVAYTVTGSELVDKTRISQNPDVWADTPGRLLLITCLQRPDGSASRENLVITATRIG